MIDTSNTTPTVTDAAIDAETNRIVAESLAKHNMSIDQLPPALWKMHAALRRKCWKIGRAHV